MKVLGLEEKTFLSCLSAFIESRQQAVKKGTTDEKLGIIRHHIPDNIQKKNITDLKIGDFRPVFKKLEDQGKIKTLHKTFDLINNTFDYSIFVLECCEYNVIMPMRRFLPKQKIINHPFLMENEMPKFFTEIWQHGRLSPAAKVAFQLIAYTAVRSSEATHAKWSEFDFENKIWSIPADRMKARREHLVPLSIQVVKLLYEWKKKIPVDSEYVFPYLGSKISKHPHITGWSLNRAIHYANYAGKQSVHGFRHRFSTTAYESNLWRGDAIEYCLAHKSGGVKFVYNKAKYLDERRKLMQWYANTVENWLGKSK